MSDEDDDDLTVSDVRALLGVTRRDARWHLTDELDILCLFARATFDLRQVETTGRDVVEVTATCAFGSIDFIVPDGTFVVLDGTSFLASARSDVAATGDSDLPRIEITATTVLGRVKIVSPSMEALAEGDNVTAEGDNNTAEGDKSPAALPVEAAVEAPVPAVVPAPETSEVADDAAADNVVADNVVADNVVADEAVADDATDADAA